VLLWVPCQGPGRAGFAVSRQIRGAAPRNRAKRRLREAYRCLGQAPAPGMNLVFVARTWALEAPLGELRTEMSRVLAEAGGSASA